MEKSQSQFLQICFNFLFLLVGTFATEKSTSPYVFYYTKGNYHVAHDDVMTGCIHVPHTVNGARHGNLKIGGQCAHLYARDDCQGPRLQSPTGYPWSFILDEVSSFHLCSSNLMIYPLTTTRFPPTHKASRISLFDHAVFSDKLIEYSDLQQCENLPEKAVNKVSSVNTHGNCVRLFAEKGCQGKMHEMTPTSLYHWDLSRLRFNNKASSISPCGGGEVGGAGVGGGEVGGGNLPKPAEKLVQFQFRPSILRRKRNTDHVKQWMMPSSNNFTHQF